MVHSWTTGGQHARRLQTGHKEEGFGEHRTLCEPEGARAFLGTKPSLTWHTTNLQGLNHHGVHVIYRYIHCNSQTGKLCLLRVDVQGYETLDLKASGQVAASVKPVIDIIKISYDAWRELDRRVFIAAWMITGYFSADHFPQDTSAEQVEHMEHAKTIIDPCGLFDTCSIDPTPQMCTRYEWQIEDHFLRGGGGGNSNMAFKVQSAPWLKCDCRKC